MAQTAEKLGNMTIGEFDRLVEDAPEGVEYELVDGTPMLMGNPTQVHEQIVSNIVAPLHTAMKPRDAARSQATCAFKLRTIPPARTSSSPT